MSKWTRESNNPDEMTPFLGHYVAWRRARIGALVDYYGHEWFPGKRILELGCGYGHIGINLAMLGADVTFSDARQEHLDEIADVWPVILQERLICANMENEWPFEGHWDLVLHQGLLYHLKDWSFSLKKAAGCCTYMALESEVLDSGDHMARRRANEDPDKTDSSIDGRSIRVPQIGIETVLSEAGFGHDVCLDRRLNTATHKYTWPIRNTGLSDARTRRWWWCWRDGHGPA